MSTTLAITVHRRLSTLAMRVPVGAVMVFDSMAVLLPRPAHAEGALDLVELALDRRAGAWRASGPGTIFRHSMGGGGTRSQG
jgi:hypothetical protein